MWTQIQNFYNSNKYAILWTVGYVVVTWAIMRYMFNFDIFSVTRWHQLMHAHLHGFAGFVFGILILAMIPLYVATTIVITRTKAPLFNLGLKIPEFVKTFFKKAFTQTPMSDEPETEIKNESDSESTSEPETKSGTDSTPPPESNPTPIPATVPAEMRVAYERARDNIARTQSSVFDLGNMTRSVSPGPVIESVPSTQNDPEIPIPTDFDIGEFANTIDDDIPVFSDLDLDDESETPEPDPQTTDIKTTIDSNDEVIKYLTTKSVPYTVENDVVITDKFAVVSHTDSDFWVADNESWFAAGKIRKSPITSVLNAAATHHVTPVLYLGADNIMDIQELRPQWEDKIIVITKPDELDLIQPINL